MSTEPTADWNALVEALSDPGMYAHGPNGVLVEQTHISVVFIAPPYVYKLKRPLELGFLDYSTLAKRAEACRQELELNRRTSEGVYLEVLAIVPDGEGFRFEPWGSDAAAGAIEVALKMRYLKPEFFLDRMLDRDGAGPEHMQALAPRLQEVFAAAPRGDDVAAHGRPAAIQQRLHENHAQVEPFVGRWVEAPWVAWNRAFTDGFVQRHGELLRARAATHVIDGHGDLHAQHVHFGDGRPTGPIQLIDCIEFNDAYRTNDVVSELAFLLMDLDERGHRELAVELLEAYGALDDDAERTRLLPFYLSYRAFVRGKVESLRAATPGMPETDQSEAVAAAKRYLRTAARYALFGWEPTVVAVCGAAGSGKSTLAKALSELLATTRHASDQIRRSLAGLPLDADSQSPEDRGIYSSAMTDRTYASLSHFAVREAQKTGLGLCDATFLDAERRSVLSELCRERGLALWWLALDAEPALLRERVASRPRGESEATPEVLERQLEQWQTPGADEGTAVVGLRGTETIQAAGEAILRAHLDAL